MAEQGRMVMPTVGATGGSRGRLACNTVKLYNTSNRASYDAGGMNSSYSLGHPSGSVFTANQRPAIYHRPSLDLIDIPQYRLPLSDSLMSQTKRHYQPHIRSDCWRYLPNVVNKPRGSSFHQLRSHLETAAAEDKTEYQRVFVPHPLTTTVPPVYLNHVTVGPKQESVYTRGADLQPITFQDRGRCTVEPHQTYSSVTKSDFMPPSFLQGTEARPGLCGLASRETGFTRGTAAPLACPASLLPSPQTKSNAPTKMTTGKKELTGGLLNAPNNQTFPRASFDCSHFTTHYNSMFCHGADYAHLKSRHTSAGTISARMDSGFSRRNGQIHL